VHCVDIGSLLSIYWVSFVYILGLFCEPAACCTRLNIWCIALDIFGALCTLTHIKKKISKSQWPSIFSISSQYIEDFSGFVAGSCPVRCSQGGTSYLTKKKSRKSESWYILQSHWRGVERVLKKKKGKKPWLSKSFSARIQRRNMLSMTCMEHVGYVMYPPPHMTCILLV
jgi:hypothetical protein